MPDFNQIKIQFGNRIKELRRDKKMSQEELAELAYLHRTYIGGIERGERNICLVNLKKIANAFNMSISKLLENL